MDNRLVKKGKQRPSSQKVGSFTILHFLAHRNTFTYDYCYDCTKKEQIKKEKVKQKWFWRAVWFWSTSKHQVTFDGGWDLALDSG